MLLPALSARHICAEEGPDFAATGRQARAALDLVPGAVAWLERLPAPARISPRIFAKRCAPTMIRTAADGIGRTDTPDCDARRRALLETAIAACPVPMRRHRVPEVSEVL